MSPVRTATSADVQLLREVLADAFFDDPLMAWAFPDPAVRPRRLEALWAVFAGRGYVPRGACTVLDDAAAALWLPPGEELDDEFWDANLEDFVVALDADLERLGQIGPAFGPAHPRDRDHWYLLAIGVRGAQQGRGLGAQLLAHTLKQADGNGQPAYLEATSPRSRALYERHGFEVLAELSIPGAPPVWSMWREPGRTASGSGSVR